MRIGISLAFFKNKLYVAALNNLFVLDNGALKPLDIGLGDNFTFGDLNANDGVLWSAGSKHLAYTKDGKKWQQVFVD